MPMRIHKAEDRGAVLHYCIHLDESRVQEDGTPDPAACREYEWSKEPPAGVSQADHEAAILREMKLLAQLELDAMSAAAPTPLAVQGQAL